MRGVFTNRLFFGFKRETNFKGVISFFLVTFDDVIIGEDQSAGVNDRRGTLDLGDDIVIFGIDVGGDSNGWRHLAEIFGGKGGSGNSEKDTGDQAETKQCFEIHLKKDK